MRHSRFLALLLILAGSLPIFAATPVAEYRLGPGDVITVTVVDHPTFGGQVTVLTDGTVQLPVINQVVLAGLTVPDAIKRLAEAYKKRLVNPEIYVTVSNPQLARAYISGAVAKPGAYTLSKNLASVVDLLMAAGGVTRPLDLCVATLVHKDGGERIPVRLAEVLAGDRKADLPLSDGDLLSIDQRILLSVFVVGEVEAPGVYDLPEGATASQALTAARGIKGIAVSLVASILRGKTVIPLDLPAIYAQQNEADPRILQGDILRVESAKITVTVAGDVRTPASFSPLRGTDISEVITLAGGANDTALLTAVKVTHADGTVETIDLSAPPATRKRLALLSGDAIFVPSTLVTVQITGEVKNPGTFQLSPQVTLQEAIAMAGGLTPLAAKSAVRVHHPNNTVDACDLASATATKMVWQSGDRIIVSPMTAHVMVIGNVVTPGMLPFDPAHPYTATEAVILAGGPKPKSALKKAQLRRVDVKELIPVNLEAAMKKLDPKKDVPLQAGDVIYIPQSGGGFSFSDVMNALSAAVLAGRIL